MLDSGTSSSKENVNIKDALVNASESYTVLAEKSNSKILTRSLSLSEDTIIFIDPHHIQTILRILITNAIQYGSNTHPVYITDMVHDNTMRISVSNAGD